MSAERTYNVGHVHVGDPDAINRERSWICAENCPHPDHATGSEADPAGASSATTEREAPNSGHVAGEPTPRRCPACGRTDPDWPRCSDAWHIGSPTLPS